MTAEPLVDEESIPPQKLGMAARAGRAIASRWDLIAILALATILWLPRLSGPIDLRWDAGVYYLLGTSLAEGHGYRILSEPGSPQAVQYPPLLPGVVALYERVCGSTDPAVVGPWLRLSYAGLFLAYAIGALILARKFLDPLFAFMATAVCLLHVWTIFLSDGLFAELPFALVSVVFALVVLSDRGRWRPWLQEAASFLLALAGFLLRTAGIVLLVAWVIDAVVRKGWQLALIRLVVALLPVVLWQGYVESVRGSNDYRHPAYQYQRAAYQNYNVTYNDNLRLKDSFKPELGMTNNRSLAIRVLKNLSLVPIHLGEAISVPRQFWQVGRFGPSAGVAKGGYWLMATALALLVVVGCGILVTRSPVISALIVLSVALICLTPWPEQFTRYLNPVAPFIAIAALISLQRLCFGGRILGARGIQVFRIASIAFLMMLLLLQGATAAKFIRGGTLHKPGETATIAAGAHFFHGQDWLDWEDAVSWIAAHADPGDVVATTAPHQLYLRTGLKAIYPPFEADAAEAGRQLESVPVNFVLVDDFKYRDFSRRYALPAVQNNPSDWHLVYSLHRTMVYRRLTKGS